MEYKCILEIKVNYIGYNRVYAYGEIISHSTYEGLSSAEQKHFLKQ